MRFLFVDRIHDLGQQHVRGEKHFGVDDPMQYNGPGRPPEVAPGVVSEAIGQLASWLCIKQNNFTGRPVFMFADGIETLKPVAPGTTVELTAHVTEQDEQTCRFSGEALVDGEVVQRIADCQGYFMPLSQLEDPAVSRKRFEHMMNGGLKLEDATGRPYKFEQLIDEVLDVAPGASVVTKTSMRESQPFYRDHFPRYPVTPIVMINEMIGCATKKMMQDADSESLRQRANSLTIKKVSNIKIKSFVRPNDVCLTKVKVLARDGDHLVTRVEIQKDGKPILRGKYEYQFTE